MKNLHFGVTKQKQEHLYEQMSRLKVQESDFDETFLLSGKKGGQNANKVSTKVRLKHIPTGIEVVCSKERSQNLNRFLARRKLLEKLEYFYFVNKETKETKYSSRLTEAYKKKKQKAKKRQRSKRKYLKN